MQQHLPGADEAFANPMEHAAVALVVLGAAMASAIWVPNVEFIFGRCRWCHYWLCMALNSFLLSGLTGATASVLMAYILPALTFIRLLDNSQELSGPSTTRRQQSNSDADEVGP